MLLTAVVAWAIFKAWGVWQREQEHRAELAEDMAFFRAEEAERRAEADKDSPDAPAPRAPESGHDDAD